MPDTPRVPDATSPTKTKLRCPRCGRVWWSDPEAAFAERCPSCGGNHLAPHLVAQILGEELGFSPADLRAGGQGVLVDDAAGCPSCDGPLSRVPLAEVTAEICQRCGGAWFDAGELEALSHGRHRERGVPDSLARKYLPKALAPGVDRRYVRVPPASAVRSVSGAGVIFVGMLGFMFPLLPLVGMAVGSALAYQRGVILDLKERKVASITSLVFRMRGTWRDWRDFSSITVQSEYLQRTPTGRARFRFRVRLIGVDVPTLEVVRTTDRVLAHRFAFQISQLAGLRVEHPRELPPPPAEPDDTGG